MPVGTGSKGIHRLPTCAEQAVCTLLILLHRFDIPCLGRVACQRGHVSAVRQLLAALHRTNYSLDCGVLALGYASSTCNTDAIAAVLDSAQLSVQLAR